MRAVLAIGSNYGFRQANVSKALEWLGSHSKVIRTSGIYESPDCYGGGKKYMNSIVEIETGQEEEQLNLLFKEYEIQSGRDETRRKRGEVPVDIDIVMWGPEIRRMSDYNAQYFKKGYAALRNSEPITQNLLK